MTTCWCGNADLLSFSSEYGECSDCGSLVSLRGIPDADLQVRGDETGFYAKEYWLSHQSGDLGFPDIYTRARNDLTERNLHWLKTLLKYRLPPAKVLELGCAHGSFVALLRQAGYDASGLEMSPWVVEFGRKTFGVPISVGPIEALDLPAGSFDVIALMDVLEHLPAPVETMAHCLSLLKPDGVMIIQTPQYRKGMKHEVLLETKDAFLGQLKADEHLYLFTEDSATRLFQQLGAEHIQFEAAIFSLYDMFFAVSRVTLRTYQAVQVESALLATPNGRIAQGFLDLDQEVKNLNNLITKLKASITELTTYKTNADSQVQQLTQWVHEARAETQHQLHCLEDSNSELMRLREQMEVLSNKPSFRNVFRLARRFIASIYSRGAGN